MLEKEAIRAFAISARAKNLRQMIHDLAVARIITGVLLDHDARQIEKALAQAKESAPKTNLKFTISLRGA